MKFDNVVSKLKRGQIYLILNNSRDVYFDKMIIKDELSNITVIELPVIHVGMFQDSVLISLESKNGEYYDVRYFPYIGSRMRFYKFSNNGYIYNSGDNDINIVVKEKSFVIKSGEEIFVQ